MKQLFSLDVGLVVDLGGVFAQTETRDPGETMDNIGDITDGIGDSVGGYTLPFVGAGLVALSQTAKAVEETTKQAAEKGLLDRLAFYIGPSVNLGFLYFTMGPCIGGFGCLAIGGGFRFGSFGIGVLIPIWKWWWIYLL